MRFTSVAYLVWSSTHFLTSVLDKTVSGESGESGIGNRESGMEYFPTQAVVPLSPCPLVSPTPHTLHPVTGYQLPAGGFSQDATLLEFERRLD